MLALCRDVKLNQYKYNLWRFIHIMDSGGKASKAQMSLITLTLTLACNASWYASCYNLMTEASVIFSYLYYSYSGVKMSAM